MSGVGLDFNEVPGVAVGASEAAVNRAQAPKINPGIQLAGALQDLVPELKGLALRVSAEDQNVQNQAARSRAIATGGQALADAVRAGKIEPTQNPFFIQDYNREAAAVSSQARFDALNLDASQWAEKNDPTAFRTKYGNAVAEISKDYQGSQDSMEGFASTAHQATQQAYEANTAQNVSRITSERQENLSALTAKQIIQTNATKGGAATGADLDAAILPLKQQWLSTGGDLAAWNKVAIQGVLAASYNTHSDKILDAAKTMSNGLSGETSGSLYDTLGTAAQIETERYRLFADKRDQMRLQIQARQQQVYEQGLAAQGALFNMFGPRLYTGQVTPDDMTTAASHLSSQFPAAAVAEGFKSAATVTNSIRELNANRSSLYEQSPGGATHIASMFQEGQQRGWTPELQSDLGQLLLQGNITVETQQKIATMASQTTVKANTTPGFNGAFAANKAAKFIDQWSATRSAITLGVTQRIRQAYSAGHAMTPQQQQAAQDVAISAASAHLQLQPGDFGGAVEAADKAAINWGKSQ